MLGFSTGLGSIRSRRTPGDAGSTLMVVVVLLTIVLTLAAVLLPAMAGAIDRARVAEAQTLLERYEWAVLTFEDDVDSNPGTLEQVTRQIIASDRDSCGGGYNNRQLRDDDGPWNGPYVTRVVPGHGNMSLGIGAAQNQLVRDPAQAQNPNAAGVLKVMVLDVSRTDAEVLGRRVDGFPDAMAGKVRWEAGSDPGLVTLEYRIPITGC